MRSWTAFQTDMKILFQTHRTLDQELSTYRGAVSLSVQKVGGSSEEMFLGLCFWPNSENLHEFQMGPHIFMILCFMMEKL